MNLLDLFQNLFFSILICLGDISAPFYLKKKKGKLPNFVFIMLSLSRYTWWGQIDTYIQNLKINIWLLDTFWAIRQTEQTVEKKPFLRRLPKNFKKLDIFYIRSLQKGSILAKKNIFSSVMRKYSWIKERSMLRKFGSFNAFLAMKYIRSGGAIEE